MPQALCPMPHAPCSMLHPRCVMLHALCPMLSAGTLYLVSGSLKIYRLLCFSLYKKTASCYDPPQRRLEYSVDFIDRRRTSRRRQPSQWIGHPGMTPFAGIWYPDWILYIMVLYS
jgi:hypothetical protein